MNTLNWSELNFENSGEWPAVLKYLCAVVLFLLLVGLGYWLMIKPHVKEYETLAQQETFLRKQLVEEQRQAAQLPAYRQQLLTMQHQFAKMRKQLSKQNEMPSVLADLSKTGIASGLTFELFAPQFEVAHDFYMELPINLVVVGNYHQFALFLSRIAQMNRMVTPHDFEITPYENQAGLLTMRISIKVYWAREDPRL